MRCPRRAARAYAGELLTERERDRVLQVRSADLHDVRRTNGPSHRARHRSARTFGSSRSTIAVAPAMCIAVGKVSFDDCDRLTWSFGWIGVFEPSSPPSSSIARFAMTSFDVHVGLRARARLPDVEREVVVERARRHLVRRRHDGSSPEGRIEEAELHVDLRGSLLEGSPSRGSPRVGIRSASGQPIEKWWSERWVCAPQYRLASTSMGPKGRSRSGTRSCQKHRSGTERPAPTHERSGADRLWIVEVARAADGVFERGDTGRFTGEVWLRGTITAVRCDQHRGGPLLAGRAHPLAPAPGRTIPLLRDRPAGERVRRGEPRAMLRAGDVIQRRPGRLAFPRWRSQRRRSCMSP